MQAHENLLQKTHRYQTLITPSGVLVITSQEYQKKLKDLRVAIDDKLSFDQHINGKINTAKRVLGTTRRNFSYIGIDNFSQLYKALVYPHLEFTNHIWTPHLKKNTEALENVQPPATKMLPKLRDLSYPGRLRILKLPTLAYCRLRGDMIELYKILSGKYDLDISNNFIQLSDHNANTRGHHLNTKKTGPRMNIHKNPVKLRKTDICLTCLTKWYLHLTSIHSGPVWISSGTHSLCSMTITIVQKLVTYFIFISFISISSKFLEHKMY